MKFCKAFQHGQWHMIWGSIWYHKLVLQKYENYRELLKSAFNNPHHTRKFLARYSPYISIYIHIFVCTYLPISIYLIYLIPTNRQQFFGTASLWWDWTVNFYLRFWHHHFMTIPMVKTRMTWCHIFYAL